MVTGERKNSCTNVWIIFKIQIGMEGQRHSGTPEGTTRNLYMTLILSKKRYSHLTVYRFMPIFRI